MRKIYITPGACDIFIFITLKEPRPNDDQKHCQYSHTGGEGCGTRARVIHYIAILFANMRKELQLTQFYFAFLKKKFQLLFH